MKVLNAEKTTEYPVLSGPAVKGATCRTLIPFIVALTHELAGESKLSVRRAWMVQGLVRVQDVLENSGLFLNTQQATELDAAVQKLLTNYHYVAARHVEQGNVRYNVKFHYASHLAAMGSVINPHKLNTYTEERFIATGARFYNHGAHAGRAQVVILKNI